MDNAPAPDSVPLSVARRENFARLVVAGRNQSDAYREAYPNARAWRDSTVHVKASQLANRPEVAGRILALKREAASNSVATARELQETLTRQLREADAAGDWRGTVASGKLLADVCGFNAPIREERTIKEETSVRGFALGSKEAEAQAVLSLFLLNAEVNGLEGAEKAREAWEVLRRPVEGLGQLDENLSKDRLRALEDAGAKVEEVEG